MNICYDGSFPESARVLTLLGADLSCCRPTGRPGGSAPSPCAGAGAREYVYYAAVNRVGDERGFRFIGRSRIVAPRRVPGRARDTGAICYAEIDPAEAAGTNAWSRIPASTRSTAWPTAGRRCTRPIVQPKQP